jgi:hypothetical protein
MDRETGRLSAVDQVGDRYVDAMRGVRDKFWEKNSVPTQTEVPLAFNEMTGTGMSLTPHPQTIAPVKLVEGPREAKPLSVRRSMAITEHLNKRLPHGKSDPLSLRPPPTPVEEAENTLNQAIRAARERAAPGMNALNEQRGEMLSVMKQLQNYTLNRAGNAEPIPFRTLYGIGIGGGLAAAGQGIGAVAGGTALPLIVNSPKFKARTGIALYHGDAGLDALGKMGRAGAQNLTRAAVGEDLVRDAIMQAMQQNTEIP